MNEGGGDGLCHWKWLIDSINFCPDQSVEPESGRR